MGSNIELDSLMIVNFEPIRDTFSDVYWNSDSWMHVLRMNTWDCYDEGAKLNRIDKSSIATFKKT